MNHARRSRNHVASSSTKRFDRKGRARLVEAAEVGEVTRHEADHGNDGAPSRWGACVMKGGIRPHRAAIWQDFDARHDGTVMR
jgi:hypothetical protein